MRRIRLIPRLDIKGPHLVKGIHLEGLRVLGDPALFAKRYYEQGADELLFVDVVASLYERNSLHEIVTRTVKDVFMPITVGGGIRTLNDIYGLLRVGADKVSINTAAIKNPHFIREAANEFGSSTIIVAIEAVRQPNGSYEAFIDNGREKTGLDAIRWAKEAEALGAGEILITSVDREGTGQGYDLDLVGSIANSVQIPIIAHGGAGSVEDIAKIAAEVDISGVACASVIHYDLVSKTDTAARSNTSEGNTEFLKSKKPFGKIKPCGLDEIKKDLRRHGILTRKTEGLR